MYCLLPSLSTMVFIPRLVAECLLLLTRFSLEIPRLSRDPTSTETCPSSVQVGVMALWPIAQSVTGQVAERWKRDDDDGICT